MEKVEYQGISFDVIRTLRCIREHVTDDAKNYLYTHWDFVIEANWQPVFVAYTDAGAGPVATPGTLPGATDLAILQKLLQPRGILKVTAGASVILETPTLLPDGRRYPCDVTGGPVCKVIGVPKMIGTRHWVVTLHFTADVRPITRVHGQIPSDDSAILTNLWVGNEDIDFQRRTTRYFQGQAILRADVMRAAFGTPGGLNANYFRDFFLFPCPRHYQRQNVRVKMSEDGTTLDWSFEDAMRGYDLGATSPIVSIECFRTTHMQRGTFGNAMVQVGTSIARDVATNWWNPYTFVKQGLTAPGQVFGAQLDNLPKTWKNIRCDLIGDRNADLGQLSRIALGVCYNELNIGASISLFPGTYEVIFRQDIADQVYTSAEISAKVTIDINIGDILKKFCTDHRELRVSAGTINMFNPQTGMIEDIPYGSGLGVPTVVADRSGLHYIENPSFNNTLAGGAGGHGVAPYDSHFNPTTGAVNFQSIEKMVVQILLGEHQAPPPQPGTLSRLSSYPGGGL